MRSNIALQAALSQDVLRHVTAAPSLFAPAIAAAVDLRRLALEGPLSFESPTMARLLGELRVLGVASLQTPDLLVQLGVWDQAPTNAHVLAESPRYFPGRHVLAPLDDLHTEAGNPHYMKVGASRGGVFVTHRAVVERISAKSVCLLVDSASGAHEQRVVSLDDILKLNQPHDFSPLDKEALRVQLEDGVQCNYASGRIKAKMTLIGFALAPLVANLDFAKSADEVIRVQMECVRTLVAEIDMVSFHHGVDPHRSCRVSEVGRLSFGGQGHCHTMTSVAYALLHPWGHLLGIDVRYMGGDVLRSGESVSNTIERHHWLQLTLRPSMTMMICDLHRAANPSGGGIKWWCTAMEDVYSHDYYPHPDPAPSRSVSPKWRPASPSDVRFESSKEQ